MEKVIPFPLWRIGGVRDIDIPFEGVIGNIKRRYHETMTTPAQMRLIWMS